MVDDNRDSYTEDLQISPSVPWEPAKYGEQASFDDIVRLDPALVDILKPEDGFRVTFEGYKYSVKVYENDRIIVYRQKPSYSSSSQSNGYTTNRYSSSSNQFKDQNYDYKGPDSLGLNHICIGNKTIKEVKLVKLDEQYPEEGWEIHPIDPVKMGNDGAYVVLVRWEVKRKE